MLTMVKTYVEQLAYDSELPLNGWTNHTICSVSDGIYDHASMAPESGEATLHLMRMSGWSTVMVATYTILNLEPKS